MSDWPSTKARVVYRALLKIGWTYLPQVGSHKKLSHPSFPNYIWSFADGDELGPAMLARIAKKTGVEACRLVTLWSQKDTRLSLA